MFKKSRTTYSRSEHSKIFHIQKMVLIVDKEVTKYHKLISIVRDKSRAICELLSDPSKLQTERDFARQTRDKF